MHSKRPVTLSHAEEEILQCFPLKDNLLTYDNYSFISFYLFIVLYASSVPNITRALTAAYVAAK